MMQKFGLAYNFWPKKYKVNYAEVWACPQLLTKEFQSELCRYLGSLQHLANRIEGELSRRLGLPTTSGKTKQSELSRSLGMPTTSGNENGK